MKGKAYELLENHKLVLDAFGFWPSFHDAEVCWLRLDRMKEGVGVHGGPALEFELHFWETTGEVDEDGYFRLVNHNLVHFRFEDVRAVELLGFNHQNAIFELKISAEPQNEEGVTPLKVVFESCYGLGGEFKACRGRVMAVTPCNENGNDIGKTAAPRTPLPRRLVARPCGDPTEK
ncbi:MAG: hypothetical protein HZB23_15280 [Deltaproteobacteria bacterium]|nr:hypothetical protein [Deltaproteobacteria bacterium]